MEIYCWLLHFLGILSGENNTQKMNKQTEKSRDNQSLCSMYNNWFAFSVKAATCVCDYTAGNTDASAPCFFSEHSANDCKCISRKVSVLFWFIKMQYFCLRVIGSTQHILVQSFFAFVWTVIEPVVKWQRVFSQILCKFSFRQSIPIRQNAHWVYNFHYLSLFCNRAETMIGDLKFLQIFVLASSHF